MPLMALATVINARAQSTDYPTEYSSACLPYLNPTYAYDGNLSTNSSGSVVQGVKGAKSACETWYGFSAVTGTNFKLNVTSSGASGDEGGTGGSGWFVLYYSLDGGATFKEIYFIENGSRGKKTDSISLSNSQDLAKVQVKGDATALDITMGGGAGFAHQEIYEISITYTP
jgi:hypothetical protein